MKKIFRNIVILLTPFLTMVLVNENMRSSATEKPYLINNTKAINSGEKLKNKCTWHCHNDTNYCKENHVKRSKGSFKTIDPIYFGLIYLLKSTGNYFLAKIFCLVILFPLII